VGRPLLLDLFCGAGGCSVGYHRAGFDVVGIDHKPQPSYPFPFIQGDALWMIETLVRGGGVVACNDEVYRLRDIDAIHASPPCQRYSIGRHIHTSGDRHPDLVEPTRKWLTESGKPWVMENVPGSPLTNAATLCGLMFGLRVLRHRLFEASFLLMAPTHPKHPRGNLTNSNKGYSGRGTAFVCVAGHNFVRTEAATAMGIDWMATRHELAQAIPPVYTEYLGRQLREVLP
jgi:DNA (cytosine-5)-methyltransferase 1